MAKQNTWAVHGTQAHYAIAMSMAVGDSNDYRAMLARATHVADSRAPGGSYARPGQWVSRAEAEIARRSYEGYPNPRGYSLPEA